MQCKDLEFVLESEGLGTLSAEAREHLAACSSCQGLLADFHSIVAVAQTLPAELEPPARVWISLRAQLEAEGLIQEPVESLEPAPWWESLRLLFRPRSLAAASAGLLLVAGTLYFTHRPANTPQRVAANPPAMQVPQPQVNTSPVPTPTTDTGTNSRRTAKPRKEKGLLPSPSDNIPPVLTQAQNSGSPDMQLAGDATVDASFRENLRTLNQFIAECQHHLRQNPQDELAREYLNMAYQQKAELLATMMDNGRSEH